jgi:hypothetical protein
MGSILLIDPFNYYGLSHFISYETKHDVSQKMHPQLWKLLDYKNKQTDRIILGDSRSNLIDTDHVKNISGNDVYNFSYGGGTLLDMIETFWYANRITKLKEVYLGINFNLYNGFENNNRLIQAKSIAKNIFSYSFSKVVFATAFKNIVKEYFSKDLQIGNPEMSFEEFWKYHLESNGKRYYQKYVYPVELHEKLREIALYCQKNNINLTIFIPPNHIDWQKLVTDFKLTREYSVFLSDMNKLGKVYNFDLVNEFTSNKKNFRDPVHPVNDSLLVNTIWNIKYSR